MFSGTWEQVFDGGGGGGGCQRAKIEKINKWNNIGVLSLSKNDQKKRGSHIKIDAFSISVYGAVCIPRQKARYFVTNKA